jgi:hypothetical protein
MDSRLFGFLICFTVWFDAIGAKAGHNIKLPVSVATADSIPSWVRELYEQTDTMYVNETRAVLYFRTLSDTSSYVLYTMSTGTCFRTYVASQRNKHHFTALNISEECDQDFSDPEYSRITYIHDAVRQTIIITVDTEKADPKYLIKTGNSVDFKKGYDMETAKITHDIKKQVVIIEKTGNLSIQNKNKAQ